MTLCRLERPRTATWNAEAVSSDLIFTGTGIADPAVCLLTSSNAADEKLEFAALRYASDASAPQPLHLVNLLSMALSGSPVCVEWMKAHQLEVFRKKFPMGLIAIVTSDNTVTVYDPRLILKGFQATLASTPGAASSGVKCDANYGLVCKWTHKGPGQLTCVDLDRCSSSLMACGDTRGNVHLVDLETGQLAPITIEIPQGSVNVLKWHPMSKDVLMAGSQQGVAVLNSKSRKPLIIMADPSKRQNVSGLCWLESGKSIAVVYNDKSRGGVIQIFDLRHSSYPIKEFQHLHQEAIIGLRQSTVDPRFFTTASRDGKCVTWVMNGPSVSPYSETSADEDILAFDTSQAPGLSCVSVALTDCLMILPREGRLLPDSVPLKFAPSWLASGNGVDFGFGGKMAWFSSSGQDDIGGISNICCDDVFIETVRQFLPFFEAGDLGGFCSFMRQSAGDPECYEAQLWSVLELTFLPMEHRADRLLSMLGFNAEVISAQMESFLGHVAGSSLLGSPETAADSGVGDVDSRRPYDGADTQHDTENFFNRLAHENSVEPDFNPNDETEDVTAAEAPVATGDGYFVATGNSQWQKEPLKLLKEAFIVGSPLGAIEMALAAKQFGLAFMLASSLNDATVLAMVKKSFLESNRDPFVNTMARASDANFQEIVAQGDLEKWKEILAILVTYPFRAEVATTGTHQEYTELCRLLASRLHQSQGDVHSAILVYLIAGAYQEGSELIGTMPSTGSGGQALKLLVIQSRSPGLQMDMCAMSVLTRFVCRCVNAGMLQLATSVLSMIDSSSSNSATTQLKFLISESTSQGSSGVILDTYEVRQSPALANQAYAAQQQTIASPLPYNHFGGGGYNNSMSQANQMGTFANAPSMGGSTFAPQQVHNAPPTAGGFNQQPYNAQQGYAAPPTTAYNASPPTTAYNAAPPTTAYNAAPPTTAYNAAPPTTAYNAAPPTTAYNAAPPTTAYNAAPPTGAYGAAPTAAAYNAAPPRPGSNLQQAASPYVPPVLSTPPPSTLPYDGRQPATFPATTSAPYPPATFNQPQRPAAFGAQQQTQQPPPFQQVQSRPTAFAGSQNQQTSSFPASQQSSGFQQSDFQQPRQNTSAFLPPTQQAEFAPPPPPAPAAIYGAAHAQAAAATPSTHPAAGVGHLQPGLPTPWPIPTATQQVGSRSSTNEKLNYQVQQATAATGAPCPPGDLLKVKQAIEAQIMNATRAGEDAKRTEEARKALGDLTHQLESAQIGREVQTKLMEYVSCVNKQDSHGARAACQAMVSIGWSAQSKRWLNTLKRLTIRAASATPPGPAYGQQPMYM